MLIKDDPIKISVMKKILYVQDALNFNPDNLEFIDFIYGLTDARLKAFFFEKEQNPELQHPTCEDNIRRFKDACHVRDIPYSIVRNSAQLVDIFAIETRYADLLLIDLANKEETIPADFAKQLLYNAECPVVIMPVNFKGIEELVFTYDGHASSVYAIKQFTYLFPYLANYKTILISINPADISEREWNICRNWMNANYNRCVFMYAEGNVEELLVEILHKRDHSFMVMGAYGRAEAGTLVVPSHADEVIQLTSQALFIAHNR